jgi:carboxylesterase type B
MQVKARFDFEMDEDCLQLNVYTKNLPSSTNSILKPVIVFIHGGAWEIGTGVDQGPHNLMDRDVVVVTINYRLGAFGFLAVGSIEAVGNAGLKDQAMALQWIQKNINQFGGDKNRVTVSGISAGGHSVTALMVSPMAKGLFSGAISMSGAITWQMKFETEYLNVAKHLAKKLNCPIDDVAAMVGCLKTVKK